MNAYKIALQEFLEGWKNKKEVTGVLVCGSYVTGNPSKHSDIDVHIILSDKVHWRERGNKIVNGFLIEYFANPSKGIPKYFKGDYEENSRCSPTQFLTGQILFDKRGKLKLLKNEARKWADKAFKKQNRTNVELQKYHLWDNLDNLQDNYEQNSKDFYYIYHNFLSEVIEIYAKYLKQNTFSIHKTLVFLTRHSVLKKYLAEEFPDKKFVKLFTKALIENNKKQMIFQYEKLTKYVLTKMGGFNIDGWKIRTSVKG